MYESSSTDYTSRLWPCPSDHPTAHDCICSTTSTFHYIYTFLNINTYYYLRLHQKFVSLSFWLLSFTHRVLKHKWPDRSR
jgi:hypothetical protein